MSGKKRALLTLEFMPSHGGIERFLHQRARCSHPEMLTVFTAAVPGAGEFDRLQPYRLQRSCGCLGRLGQGLWPLLSFLGRCRHFDLVECGQAFPYPLAGQMMKKLCGTPYWVWVHGNDLLAIQKIPLLRGWQKAALQGAERVLTLSRFVAELVQQTGVPAQRIFTIKRTVDTSVFHPAPPDPELLARHRLAGKRVLLTVGRLVERKGHDHLIRALAGLRQKYPDLVYLIVGQGPERERLQRLAAALGVAEAVCFAGSAPETALPAYYNLAEIFVMVSRFIASKSTVEGFGLVYVEANACGKPVIAGNSGGAAEAVIDGVNGLLVDPASVGSLTAALSRLLEDRQLARQLGERGLELARQPANWEILDRS